MKGLLRAGDGGQAPANGGGQGMGLICNFAQSAPLYAVIFG
nr:MAG TPA: hypothetical protein [Caudoviricetes sp.]